MKTLLSIAILFVTLVSSATVPPPPPPASDATVDDFFVNKARNPKGLEISIYEPGASKLFDAMTTPVSEETFDAETAPNGIVHPARVVRNGQNISCERTFEANRTHTRCDIFVQRSDTGTISLRPQAGGPFSR